MPDEAAYDLTSSHGTQVHEHHRRAAQRVAFPRCRLGSRPASYDWEQADKTVLASGVDIVGHCPGRQADPSPLIHSGSGASAEADRPTPKVEEELGRTEAIPLPGTVRVVDPDPGPALGRWVCQTGLLRSERRTIGFGAVSSIPLRAVRVETQAATESYQKMPTSKRRAPNPNISAVPRGSGRPGQRTHNSQKLTRSGSNPGRASFPKVVRPSRSGGSK